jgi:hypothetical protein
VHFGPLSPKLASFGIAPPKKVRKLTAVEKLVAVARRRQTRAANLAARAQPAAPVVPGSVESTPRK